MVKTEYLYNNEAIGVIAMSSVIKNLKEVSFGKAVLILPFLFHEETTAFLKRPNSVIRSIEEIMVKKTAYFGNFNSRYYSLLPISINSVMLLKQMGEIKMRGNKVIYVGNCLERAWKVKLGERALNIIRAADKLANLLDTEDDTSLYLKLRIQL